MNTPWQAPRRWRLIEGRDRAYGHIPRFEVSHMRFNSFALTETRHTGDTFERLGRWKLMKPGDGFTATGTGAVYNADGTFAFPTCATEIGTRFE